MAFGEHKMIYHTLNDNINPLQVNLVDVAASVDAVGDEAEDEQEHDPAGDGQFRAEPGEVGGEVGLEAGELVGGGEHRRPGREVAS